MTKYNLSKQKLTISYLWILAAIVFMLSCTKSELKNSQDPNVEGNLNAEDLSLVSLSTAEISSGFQFNFSNNSSNSSVKALKEVESFNNLDLPNDLTLFSSDLDRNNRNKIKSRSLSIDGNGLFVPNDTFAALFSFINLDESYKGFNFGRFRYALPQIRPYLRGVLYRGVLAFPLSGYGNSFGFNENNGRFGWGNWWALDSLLDRLDSVVFDFGQGKLFITANGDSIVRSGQITIVRTSSSADNQMVKKIIFNNYSVNNYVLNGSKTLTKTYSIQDTNFIINYNIVGEGVLVLPNGSVFNLNSTRNKKFNFVINTFGGRKTLSTKKGITETTVNFSVTTNKLLLFNYVTTSPIIEDFSCFTRVKPKNGIIDIKYLSNIININFSGDCGTKTITITINGVTYTKTISNQADNDEDSDD